jgi:hypothetical protein
MTSYPQYKVCIEACLNCAAVCRYCAISCSREANPAPLTMCIQLNLECAAVCMAAAELMAIGSERVKEICKLCATMCDACAEECSKHLHDHCRECAEVCTSCADQCEII